MTQEELAAVFAAARQAGATVLDVVDARTGRLPAAAGKAAAARRRLLAQQPRGAADHRRGRPVASGGTIPSPRRRTADRHHGRRRRGAGERVRCGCVPGTLPVRFVDGTGGGDAFDAGYIYGLLHGMETGGLPAYASALGASCVRAIGTTPGVFTRAECDAFLRSQTLRDRGDLSRCPQARGRVFEPSG